MSTGLESHEVVSMGESSSSSLGLIPGITSHDRGRGLLRRGNYRGRGNGILNLHASSFSPSHSHPRPNSYWHPSSGNQQPHPRNNSWQNFNETPVGIPSVPRAASPSLPSAQRISSRNNSQPPTNQRPSQSRGGRNVRQSPPTQNRQEPSGSSVPLPSSSSTDRGRYNPSRAHNFSSHRGAGRNSSRPQVSLQERSRSNGILSTPPRPISAIQGPKKGLEPAPQQPHTSRVFQPVPLPQDVPLLVKELTEKLLVEGSVDCMICLNGVGRTSPSWSCQTCYALFHVRCIKTWAEKQFNESAERTWRCPGCQAPNKTNPALLKYLCFCGKVQNPERNDFLTPHSCGDLCGRQLAQWGAPGCPHKCPLQCHPGPCPPCSALAGPQSCPCGKTRIVQRCSEQGKPVPPCGAPCSRQLACLRHTCPETCHEGDCPPCTQSLPAACHCGQVLGLKLCSELDAVLPAGKGADVATFSCGARCSRVLACGNHSCSDTCHSGACAPCQLLPSDKDTCHCGKTNVSLPRVTCLDPYPACGSPCGKLLECGDHRCEQACHSGDCHACRVPVTQHCRCGETSRKVPCWKARSAEHLFLCDRKCGKKKSCGRHRCSVVCCSVSGPVPSAESLGPHFCLLPCGKLLRCRLHSCDDLCHSGHCPPCRHVSFDELSCPCGTTKVPPPVPCGTALPPCPAPCSLPVSCGHQGTHLCHPRRPCPPCPVLVTRTCPHGTKLSGIPCGSKGTSCGVSCGRQLACGAHRCLKRCHDGDCQAVSGENNRPGENNVRRSCGQPCGFPRRDCGHPCAASCHPAVIPCPVGIPCQVLLTVTCPCWRRSEKIPCSQLPPSSTSASTSAAKSAAKSAESRLQCDEECAKLEKRRQLAEAFNMAPPGSDALEEASVKDPAWLAGVDARLGALLPSPGVPWGPSRYRVHVFRPMAPHMREAVHLLAEKYRIGSASIGSEPNRMVVVYATHKSRGTPKSPQGTLKFDPKLDLDPRLGVQLFGLPPDAPTSNQVIRFGGECELLWLDDQNALVVFLEPERCSTALRYLDHGRPYRGVTDAGSFLERAGHGGARGREKTAALPEGFVAGDPWGDEKAPREVVVRKEEGAEKVLGSSFAALEALDEESADVAEWRMGEAEDGNGGDLEDWEAGL